MTDQPITMRDVARAAGVHPGTVSRVLNPVTRPLVNARTADRVDRAARDLGYSLNPIARSLKTRRSYSIGVVIPDLTNPLFPPMIRGMEEVLDRAGYTTLVASTDGDADRERQRRADPDRPPRGRVRDRDRLARRPAGHRHHVRRHGRRPAEPHGRGARAPSPSCPTTARDLPWRSTTWRGSAIAGSHTWAAPAGCPPVICAGAASWRRWRTTASSPTTGWSPSPTATPRPPAPGPPRALCRSTRGRPRSSPPTTYWRWASTRRWPRRGCDARATCR